MTEAAGLGLAVVGLVGAAWLLRFRPGSARSSSVRSSPGDLTQIWGARRPYGQASSGPSPTAVAGAEIGHRYWEVRERTERLAAGR